MTHSDSIYQLNRIPEYEGTFVICLKVATTIYNINDKIDGYYMRDELVSEPAEVVSITGTDCIVSCGPAQTTSRWPDLRR